MDFLNDWKVMGGMIVAILALIGALIYMRSRPKD
jgi:hypothetical protein